MPDRHDPERWSRIEAVFEHALELPAGERAAWLAKTCAGDDALRAEVEGLLAAADAPGLLDRGLEQLAPGLAGEASDDLDGGRYAAGRELGGWRLLEPLGSGGMGRVFLAERRGDGFTQRAALKVLRWEVADSSLAERFRREQSILAGLEHPGIARLIDGGVSPDGLPWLATELVEGVDLLAWCEQQRLGVAARVELFRQVCEVVGFAHRNLVVHRDLKASNILVDASGQVKLLDFGVAKLLDEARQGELTGTQPAPATLSSAAPEQLSGAAVTTATDVWALGVLLYELLSGERPFGGGQDSPTQVMRRISEEEPEPPARRAPATRSRQLAGDLDNITLLALRKDPAQRYGSAEALAEDLRRWRRGLPVLARGDSWGYRAGKFLRRHRWPVATAAAVLLLVGSLVGFYTAQLADERDRARAEAEKTEQVKSFVLSMFEVNDPSVSQGRDISARQLLDEGARRIDEELAGQPALQVEMHGTVGGLYEMLGDYGESSFHLREAARLAAQHHGPRSEERAEVLARWGFALVELDSLEQAERLLQESVDIREELGNRDAVASSLNQLGMALSYRGDYARAEELLRESVAIKEELYGPDDPELATSLGNLGLTLKWDGRADEAEPLYRRAIDIRERTLGEDSVELAVSLDNLGVLLGQRGDFGESEQCFRRSLAIRRKVLGEDHPDVALNLNNLATLFRVSGRLDEAEPIYREVLAVNEAALGPDHRHVATNLVNLGSVLASRGEFAEAAQMYQRAVDIRRQSLGDEHIDVANAQGHLVFALLRQGEPGRAEPIAADAARTARAAVGGEHPTVAMALRNHGDVLVELGRARAAEAELREALSIQRSALGEGHWEIAATEGSLGRCLLAQGRADEALPLLRAAHAALLEARGAGDWHFERTREGLHELHRQRGEPEQAALYAPPDP